MLHSLPVSVPRAGNSISLHWICYGTVLENWGLSGTTLNYFLSNSAIYNQVASCDYILLVLFVLLIFMFYIVHKTVYYSLINSKIKHVYNVL